MPPTYVLSAQGRDRPGIVAAVARVLYEQGCNIADSSMTRLGGNFAMLLVVQAPEGRSAADLLAALAPDAARLGLTVHADPAAEGAQNGGREGASFVISVYGADQAGIVWRVAERLAALSVNITDVATRLSPGSTPLYIMILEATAPAGLPEERMRQEMAALAGQISCEITVQSVDVMRL